MKLFVYFAEGFISDVSVDLGRRNRSVPQKFLNRPDVRAVDQELGCKTVAERVGSDVFDDPGFAGIFGDY